MPISPIGNYSGPILNKIDGVNYHKEYWVSCNKGSKTIYKPFENMSVPNVYNFAIAPYYVFGSGYGMGAVSFTILYTMDFSALPPEPVWLINWTGGSLKLPGNTVRIKIEIKATSGYKEKFNIDYDGSDYYRNDLFHGTTSSRLTVTYDETNAYDYYFNGEYGFSSSSPDIYNLRVETKHLQLNASVDQSITTAGYTGGDPVGNGFRGDILLPDGEYSVTFDSQETPMGSSSAHTYHNSMSVDFVPEAIGFSSNLNGVCFSWQKPTTECLYYRYVVDNPELNIIDEDDTMTPKRAKCEFTAHCENVGWKGMESPYFYFTNNAYFQINFPGREGNVSNLVCNCSQGHRDSYNSQTGGAGYKLGNDKPIPTQLGNVTLNNPEDFNDYTMLSTKDANGLEEKDERDGEHFRPSTCHDCINTEMKINVNSFTRRYGTGLLKLNEKVLCPINNWQYYNCELIGSGENAYVYANSEGAYIYQDRYRNKYLDENDQNNYLAHTEYRQAHWTHFRYMSSSFTKIVETEEEGAIVETVEPYTPDIQLIYKPFGKGEAKRNNGHTWIAKFDGITNCYDMLTCNGGGVGISDECLGFLKVENYTLLKDTDDEEDPECGVWYLNEQAQTHIGYLPNIVGRVKIPIPANTKIKLGELKSVLSPDINMQNLTLHWVETASVNDFRYYDQVKDAQGNPVYDQFRHPVYYSGLVTSEKQTYQGPPLEYSMFYYLNSVNFTLTNATVSLLNPTIETPLDTVTLTNSWQTTFDYHKLQNFRVDLYFTEISTGYQIHCYTFIGSDSDQNYFRFRIKTDTGKVGVECEKAKWKLGNNDYDFDEYHQLKVIEQEYYSKDIPKHELIFQCGTEFKKMEYCGDHNPGWSEDQGIDSWDTYDSRFVAVAINGARCGDIPELVRVRYPKHEESIIKNLTLMGLGDYSNGDLNKPENKCPVIFPRDDLGEFQWNAKIYDPDSDGLYPIESLYAGQFTRVHYLDCSTEVLNGEWCQNVTTTPYVDWVLCGNPSRLLKSYWNGNDWSVDSWRGNSIHIKGSYGAMYNGVTNKLLSPRPKGYVKEHSPFLETTHQETVQNTEIINGEPVVTETEITVNELPIQYIDTFGAYRDTYNVTYGNQTAIIDRLHATGKPNYIIEDGELVQNRTGWRINEHKREPLIVEYNQARYGIIDGMKYTLSYVYVRGGKILRNLAGKILRNSQHKILRGDDM